LRFVLGFIVFLNTLLVALLAIGFYYGYGAWAGPGPLAAGKSITIARGSGVSTISEVLVQEGNIK
jgi:cell division protein YceG involved in septum cleavage